MPLIEPLWKWFDVLRLLQHDVQRLLLLELIHLLLDVIAQLIEP